jgi:type III secretion protein J
MPMRLVRLWMVLLVCALTACKVAVHSRGTETAANEVLAALLDAGIDADKVAVDEKSFDVEVSGSDLSRALALLKAHGLPRSANENLGQLFKKEGLVSTPAEERVRYIYGVSQELEKTLSHIDGVVHARVHIVIPANDPLSDAKKFSSASVFVKYRPPVDPNTIGPVIRTLVMRAIEGLDGEHVSVAFVAAEPSSALGGLRMVHWLGMKVSADSLWALNFFVAFMFTLPVASAAWVWRGRRKGTGRHKSGSSGRNHA